MVVAQASAAITLGLLGLAGVAKLLDPEPTRGALQAAGMPRSRAFALVLGLLELLAAITGLAIGGASTYLGAALYIGFTWFTLSGLLHRRPIQSCGCFGRDDTPPTWIHVAYNAVAVGALGWVAATGGSAIPWNSPTLELTLYLSLAAAGVFASYLLLSLLPRTLETARNG